MIIYTVELVFVSWTHDRRLDCGKISVERLPFLLINMVAVTSFDSNLLLGPWICYKKVFPWKVILKLWAVKENSWLSSQNIAYPISFLNMFSWFCKVISKKEFRLVLLYIRKLSIDGVEFWEFGSLYKPTDFSLLFHTHKNISALP